MWVTALSFLTKYLWQIIAGVVIIAAVFWVYNSVQNWCNNACEDAREIAATAVLELETCRKEAAEARLFYDNQRALWQKEVDTQKAAIEKAKKEKAAIVEKHRKPLEKIFKDNVKNEQESKERAVAQIKPSDVVTAPLALVREYNEAVARSDPAARIGGGEVGLPSDTTNLEGKVGTFDALAVREALVENLNKYNKLAARCDALVDVVVDLEKQYGTTPAGTDGKVVGSGRDVLDGAVAAQIF